MQLLFCKATVSVLKLAVYERVHFLCGKVMFIVMYDFSTSSVARLQTHTVALTAIIPFHPDFWA